MVDTTANGEYKFTQIFHKKTLEEWVQLAHKELSKASGWKYFPLQKGQFGFDNMAMSVGLALKNLAEDKNKELPAEDTVASWIHDGWVQNYTYWLTNEPWKTNKLYKKPAKPLGDARRNECAKATFSELPEDEKEKDRIIARCLLQRMIIFSICPQKCVLADE